MIWLLFFLSIDPRYHTFDEVAHELDSIALHYTMQILKMKLGLPNVARTSVSPTESSSDLRMTTKLPLKIDSNKAVSDTKKPTTSKD